MSPGNADAKLRVSALHVRQGSNTPSATSTRNELMWENFPDVSGEHWQKLNRTRHGAQKTLWSPVSTERASPHSMRQFSERHLDDLNRRTIVGSDMNKLLEDECLANGIKRYSDNESVVKNACSSNRLCCQCSCCEFGLTSGKDYENRFQTDVGNFTGSENTVDGPVLATMRKPFETVPHFLDGLNGFKYASGGSKDSWTKFTDDRRRACKETYERDAYDGHASSSNTIDGRKSSDDRHLFQPRSENMDGPTDERNRTADKVVFNETYRSLDRRSSYAVLGSERERQHLLPKNNLQIIPPTPADLRLDLDWDDFSSASLPSIPLFPVTVGGTSIEGKLRKRETSYPLHGERMPPAMLRRKWANGEKQYLPNGFIKNYTPCTVDDKSSVNSVKPGFEDSLNLNSCWRYQSVQTERDSQRHCHGGSNASKHSGKPESFQSKSRSSRSERRCTASEARSENQCTPERYFSGRSSFTSDKSSRLECPPRRSHTSKSCGEKCSLIAAYLPILYSHGCFRQILQDYKSSRSAPCCKYSCDSVSKFIPIQESLGTIDSSGRKTSVNGSVHTSTQSDWDPQSPMGRDVVDVMVNRNGRSVKEQTKVKPERFIPENDNSWLTITDNATQTRCTKTVNSSTQVKPSVRHMCNQTTNKSRNANKHCQTNSRKKDSYTQVTPTNCGDTGSQVVIEEECQSRNKVTDASSGSLQDSSTNQTIVKVYSPDLLIK